MLWIPFLIALGALAFWLSRMLSGEDERIKVFLRVYKKRKTEHPDFSERKLLEAVAEWHIPYGSSRSWKDDGLTGQQYMNGVFDNQDVVLRELIVHLMGLEYPKKYGRQSETTDEQMAAWSAGERSPKQIRVETLNTRINKFAADLAITLKDKNAEF